jgi:hypothetical protein
MNNSRNPEANVLFLVKRLVKNPSLQHDTIVLLHLDISFIEGASLVLIFLWEKFISLHPLLTTKLQFDVREERQYSQTVMK